MTVCTSKTLGFFILMGEEGRDERKRGKGGWREKKEKEREGDCHLQELSEKSKETTFPVILSTFLLNLIGPNSVICLALNRYVEPGDGIMQINLG